MNRIFLIGNGFDLAHSLPTSYNDFILAYFKSIINESLKEFPHGRYTDHSTKVYWDFRGVRLPNISRNVDSIDSISNLLKYIYDWGKGREGLKLYFKYNNEFLKELVSKVGEYGWVDIELYYYNKLRRLALKARREMKNLDGYYGLHEDYLDDIIMMNKDFSNVILLLKKYLNEIVENYHFTPKVEFKEIFENKVDKYKNFEFNNSYAVNFNYTSTLSMYSFDEIINIHGQLKHEQNPIIFGFGDELDVDYSELEMLNSNEVFRYVKSFMYLRNVNYKSLIRLVDSGAYQLVILGHSCGLSDRTLLSYLFENANCASIKVLYYKNINNYVNTVQEISRHFKNKVFMRKIVDEFSACFECPQVQLVRK